MHNTIEINNIFNKYISYNMNRYTWAAMTGDLLNYIDITEQDITNVKKEANTGYINTDLYKCYCNTPIEYTNELCNEVFINDVIKITINDIYIKAIIKLWSNDQMCLSFYENKLYYIYYHLYNDLDKYDGTVHYRLIKEWLNYLYFTKRKSLREYVNNILWGTYNEVMTCTNVIHFINNNLYVNSDIWYHNENVITNTLQSLTRSFNVNICDILITDNTLTEIGSK